MLQNNNFDVEDNECFGALKKFEDEELEALLHEDSCQAQGKLTESLGVNHTTVLKLKEVAKRYEEVASAKISFDKSEGLQLGAWRDGIPLQGPFH